MDENIFMMCKALNRQAFSALPPGFAVRTLRREELDFWKAMPFDDDYTAEQAAYMDEFFRRTYAAQEETFFDRTLVVCDPNDQIVGTCFLWQAYGLFNTLHWFKVIKAYEGRGIGRALLSILFQDVTDADLPIYLHTQPESYRAIVVFRFRLCAIDRPAHRATGQSDRTVLALLVSRDAAAGLRPTPLCHGAGCVYCWNGGATG
ncbi:MAG: GNAT family N-acetyltransferase [Caldilineaceae bacterium]